MIKTQTRPQLTELSAPATGCAFVATSGIAILTDASLQALDPATGTMGYGVVVDVLIGLCALWFARLIWVRGRSWEHLHARFVVIGTGAIISMNALDRDVSAGAQFMLALPVLFAALYLSRRVAALTTVLATVGLSGVAMANLPFDRAWHDSLYGCLVLTALAWGLSGLCHSERAATSALRYRASRDGLTGLVNRQVLVDTAPELLQQSTPVSLILIDLDHFKQVNDAHGHPAGDTVLTSVADAVACVTRSGDLLCRIGGDEFAVLLPDCAADVAAQRAQQIAATVAARRIHHDGTRIPVTVSVGTATTSPGGAATLTCLYAAADADLYRAKQHRPARLDVVTASGSPG